MWLVGVRGGGDHEGAARGGQPGGNELFGGVRGPARGRDTRAAADPAAPPTPEAAVPLPER